MSDIYPLSDIWTLWYHHINDNNWLEDSFKKIIIFESLKDYWDIVNNIETVNAGMFFMMRDDIFPRWEDINNIDGGYWTFRVAKKDSDYLWNKLMALTIGNTLTKRIEDMDEINGISISPKINNCIIKIWNRDYNKKSFDIFNEEIRNILGEPLYRRHQDQEDLKKN